jgi:hypothetical protein
MRMRIVPTAAIFALSCFAADSSRKAPSINDPQPPDTGVLTLPAPVIHETPPAPVPERELASPEPVPPVPPPALPPPAVPPPAVPPPPVLPAAPAKVPAPTPMPAPTPAAPKAPKAIQAAKPAPKLFLPPDFEKDSATYCQKRIGEWSEPDVYNLFGDPLRQRSAPSDGKQQDSGRIYAFADPSGRYREIELDFAADGMLRSVFAYPWHMTWEECRRLWDGAVTTTRANKGRTFYSYVDRHLDVLVDPSGKVISLGLY